MSIERLGPTQNAKPQTQNSNLHHLVYPFLDHPWAVGGGGSESDERELSFLKEVIQQLVSQPSVGPLVGGIVQLDGSHWTKVLWAGQNEVHVFASNRPKDAVPGRRARAGDMKEVCDANLGKNQ